METVRFGVVGYGNIGSRHCAALFGGKIGGAELAAVCDINPAKLETVKSKFGGVKTFDNAESMFSSGEIDAALIATPHYDHPPLAIKALKAGLHTLVEKPSGVYTKQVAEMNAEAAKHKDLAFAMMFNQRTSHVYRKMKEMVSSGELGGLRRVNWIITDWYRPQCYYDSGEWRATWAGEGGGVLLNQCPHNLDLWQWICGMPSSVTAFMCVGKWHDIAVEDDVTIYAEYPNGATGVFVTTTADYPGTNRLEITGDMGKLVCEGGKLTFWRNKQSERLYNRDGREIFGGPGCDVINVETDGDDQQHDGVLRAFAGNVLRGEPLMARGEEGINGLTISNAAHLSAWLGNKTVSIPFDEELFYGELMKRVEAERSGKGRATAL